MPAPSLKHYKSVLALSTWTNVSGAVAAGRALVISKITVANNGSASVTFFLQIDTASATAAGDIAASVALAPGEVYTEAGVVALAGESVFAYASTGTTNTLKVHVFGEEVDN